MTNKAIFLDRDETINFSVFNPKTEEYEAPHSPDDLKLYPYVISSLNKLQDMGFLLFIISNQPDFAKGKCSLKDLNDVHEKFHNIMIENNIKFKDYYYCYHHPEVSECVCRKPSPFYIKKATEIFKLDVKRSWMIGDRNTDIICGIDGGVRTIKIGNEESNLADFVAKNLEEAVEIIRFCENINKKEN